MQQHVREKLVAGFPEYVVDKREALRAGFERMPRFVTEFLLAKARSRNPDLSVDEVRRRLADHWVDSDKKGAFLSKLMMEGRATMIALLEIEPKPERDAHVGRIQQLDGLELVVPDPLIREFPELLSGGLWGSCLLAYDRSGAQPKIVVQQFTPYQLTRPDMSAFERARRAFTVDEWIEVLLASAGYRPTAFPTLRQRLIALARLVPFVQTNVNLIELGPRGTGKSYLLRNLSHRVYLVAGARATPASLMYDLARRSVGTIGRKKVVVFDEIASTSFPDASLVGALKDYMESGQIARGGRATASDCSLVFTGNLDIGADGQPDRAYMHLFEALPDELADTAIADRIHAFIPGWELPKISDDVLADSPAFLTDFFGEVLARFRDDARFTDFVRANVRLENATIRDRNAVEKISTGLLKLLYPDANIEESGFRTVLQVAVELRQRVHTQLTRMAPGEFPKKQISFPGMEPIDAVDLRRDRTLEERDVAANESDQVGAITILLVSNRGGGDVGFVECAHVEGRGGLAVTGLHGAVLSHSVEASYNALLHLGGGLGLLPEKLRSRKMHVHLVNMAEPKDGPSAGLAFALAMYSAATGKPIRRGFAVTGELSVHGHVGPIGGVVEKLDAAARHGRSLVVIPASNAMDLRAAGQVVRQLHVEPVATLEAALRLAIPRAFEAEMPRVVQSPRGPAPAITDSVADAPPAGQRLVAMLAAVLSTSEVEALGEQVRRHAAEFQGIDETDPRKRLADSLAAGLSTLLKLCPTMASHEQSLVVGAARYFCSDADEVPDFDSPAGLDDDLEVFNWVARQIGRGDLVIHG